MLVMVALFLFFCDPWLNDAQPFVSSIAPNGLEDITVNQLMKVESRAWDVDLIRDIFNTIDQALILQIPLSRRIIMDKWI